MITIPRKYVSIIIVLALATSFLGSVSIVYAQKNQGDYINYSFNYSATKESQTKKGEGTLREEIVKDFNNGTLRVKYSGTVNNAVFMLEKNTPKERFHFPYIPELKDGTRTFKIKNGTVTIAITRLPVETIQFQGSTYMLNVSKIEVSYEIIRNGDTRSGNANGIVKIFKSGLLYSFKGEFNGSSTGDITITLTATNIDPEAKGEANNLFLMAANFAELGNIVNTNSVTQSGTTVATTQSYALIAALIAIIGVIGAITYGRKKITRNPEQGEKPLHWVN